jgi:hypothetical protein
VGLDPGQAKICTLKARKGDTVIVQEKLDGSNVAVANVNGHILALGRAGHLAISSRFEQHVLFARWVAERLPLFDFLREGERLCGEWLAQAHGTRYALPHEPFVPFDLMRKGHERALYQELRERTAGRFVLPFEVSVGPAIGIEEALARLRPEHHGALDPIEGCVWRVEREGSVDFLAKYVRHGKEDGCYLPEISGREAVWNWRPRPPISAA